MNLEYPVSGESAASVNPPEELKEETLTIALAGNANVGKSAIFNQLTGLVQETGNWSGKTVGIREGMLSHHGRQIKIVDLPGIYSFTSYSPEELITREYILFQRPDIVVNVLDATSLERNLYFTLQLKEMGVSVVLALNYADIAKKKHINIDHTLLSKILSVPVINTIAIKGIGVHDLVDSALDIMQSKVPPTGNEIRYGPEIENRLARLSGMLRNKDSRYPSRWAAVKMLEGDQEILEWVEEQEPEIARLSQTLCSEIARIHGEDCTTVMAAERYALSARIVKSVSIREEPQVSLASRFDNISLHPVAGYFIFLATMAAILVFISFFGGWLTEVITVAFESLKPETTSPLSSIFWNGGVVGFYASLSVAVGFILPFYIILGWLGESGYLPRIAFLMDRPCHMVGLHGQASLPLIMALGCNVPACLACRIMENRRDRLIATFLSTMVPCTARTSVVLGLAGAFVGWQWALFLLIFQFILIFIIGQILNRLVRSTSPGIIMEMPEYRFPSLKVVWQQAWNRFKDFVIIGIPLIVAGSIVIESLRVFNLLDYFTRALTPLTVTWLGLPAFAGIILIFGILRKEANLALLITFAGGAAITTIISPVQMVVFSIVIMLYIPCIATIAALVKETGLRITILIVISEIVLALLVGGIAARILPLVFQS